MRVNARPGRAVWIVALVWLTSCRQSSSTTARYVEGEPPRYEIVCTVDEGCDAAVALLVGLSAPEEPMRCTATLIGPRTAVTAGHCVAWELSGGGRCDDVWLGFPQSGERQSEWVGCERISSVATSSTLLSPDYAILQLRSDIGRSPIPLGDGDFAPGEIVQMVSVTADRFYDAFHEVRRRRCVVDDSRTLAPWSPAPSPSVRVLSSCPIREGSSGAPVLDQQGRMCGLVHAGGPRYFAYGLMTLLPQQIERYDR
jgi:hypothetical protein